MYTDAQTRKHMHMSQVNHSVDRQCPTLHRPQVANSGVTDKLTISHEHAKFMTNEYKVVNKQLWCPRRGWDFARHQLFQNAVRVRRCHSDVSNMVCHQRSYNLFLLRGYCGLTEAHEPNLAIVDFTETPGTGSPD